MINFGSDRNLNNDNFYSNNRRYYYAVGFRSQKWFPSYQKEGETIYTSEIREEGGLPQFVVTAEDDSDNPCVGNSPLNAWRVVNRRRETGTDGINGPKSFGLPLATHYR